MLATVLAELVGLFVVLVSLPLLILFIRRLALQRGGGTVALSLRLRPGAQGRGWVLGVGRFHGDSLQWYRVFSLAMRPRRTLSRRDLVVVQRREPLGSERRSLLGGAVVLECRNSAGDVAIAMDRSATTGFLAWLEATPPGATLPA